MVRVGLLNLMILSLNSSPLFSVIRNYALAVMLSLLAHLLFFVAVWCVKYQPVVKITPAVPVISFLYQPIPVVLPERSVTAFEPVVDMADKGDAAVLEPEKQAVAEHATEHKTEVDNAQAVSETDLPVAVSADKKTGSLADRAFRHAISTDVDMAYDGYQQLRQQQQYPRMTVDKRFQELNPDPQQQVMMTLDNGMQILRSKEGCRLADPSKDGFDGLMAVVQVPCGDETTTAELLKQSLEKHIRR